MMIIKLAATRLKKIMASFPDFAAKKEFRTRYRALPRHEGSYLDRMITNKHIFDIDNHPHGIMGAIADRIAKSPRPLADVVKEDPEMAWAINHFTKKINK